MTIWWFSSKWQRIPSQFCIRTSEEQHLGVSSESALCPDLVEPDFSKAPSHNLTKQSNLITHHARFLLNPSGSFPVLLLCSGVCLQSEQLREEIWRRVGQEESPVKRERDRTASHHHYKLTRLTEYTLLSNVHLVTGGINMGGNISQKKGSGRASARSHTHSVTWVKFLTCVVLILQRKQVCISALCSAVPVWTDEHIFVNIYGVIVLQ